MTKFGRKEIREIVGEGCTDEVENRLIALYLAVTDPMKDEIAKMKTELERFDGVQKELDSLKAAGDYKAKFEQEHAAFENYKQAQAMEKAQAAKEEAARAYFMSKNITGANLDIAMRGAKDEIAALELDGENIKDAASLDGLIGGTFAGLVSTQSVQGVGVPHPPANTGGKLKSRAQIYERDDKGRFVLNATQRQEALTQLINSERTT